jgi:hypothetical protein
MTKTAQIASQATGSINQSSVQAYVNKAKHYGKLAGATLLAGEALTQYNGISLIGTTCRLAAMTFNGASVVTKAAWHNPRTAGMIAASGVAAYLYHSGSDDWEQANDEKKSFCQRCSLTLRAGAKMSASAGVFLGSTYLLVKF